MKNAYLRYRSHIPNLICVYSEDVYRFEKVEALRRGEHSIVLQQLYWKEDLPWRG